MTLRILSVEREYGSGGAVIAAELARRLGWKLWDQALTEEVAKLARVSPAAAERHDERRDPLLYRLAKVYARGSYESSMPVEDEHVFDAERMVALLDEGAVRPPAITEYPLADAAEAHRVSEGRHLQGKLVLIVR